MMDKFSFHTYLIPCFFILILLLQPDTLRSQEIYIPIDGAIYKIDVNSCEKELIVDLNGYREEHPMISSCVFHPDGSLYIFSKEFIYKYGVLHQRTL